MDDRRADLPLDVVADDRQAAIGESRCQYSNT